MYSPRVVTARIQEFESENKWLPIYHTYDEVLDFTKYVESLIKKDSNSKGGWITHVRRMSESKRIELERWIQNEQVLCGLDSSYWEKNYAWICDEKGQMFKFKNRRSQEIYDSVIEQFDERQVSIELLILKARQLGITSKTALKFLHRLLFLPNTQAIMASVQKERSELIKRIMDTAYSHCPWWLVPTVISKNRYDNGSILSIQSGSQATGLAQGWTPTSIHLCLESNTYIHTQNGFVKKIKDVEPGDLVLTSKHRLAPVKKVIKSVRENEVACELSLWGNYDPLVVTRDHPILTPDGFSPAENIGKHDFVVMPVRPISNQVKSISLFHNKRPKHSRDNSQQEEVIKLNREFGWLCGLYLAEGSAHQNNRIGNQHWDATYFSIHQDEVDDYKKGIHAALGMFQHVHVNQCKTSKTCTLVVYNAALTRWFVEEFGHLADGKKIPDWVFSSGKEFVSGLIRGYCEGDGHVPSTVPAVTVSSISQQLIFQLRNLLASCGYGWCGIYRDEAGIRYGRNCRARWQMMINGDYGRKFRAEMDFVYVPKKESKLKDSDLRRSSAPKHWRYSEDRKHIWIEVFENRPIDGAEFYDLEVDAPEHDFCTIHCCVKNSELADYPDPKKMIEEGLFRATHSSKNLFMVLEGTGGGNTGWLAETWRAAKEDWPKGKSRLCPVFIPWVMCPDIYPEEDWIRKFPVPSGFESQIHDVTRKQVLKCESFVRNTPYLAKVAGANWRMPIEQKWFWQFNYDTACKTHTQKTWSSQMPCDDFEALTGVHDSVFDPEVIAEVEDTIYEVRMVGDKEVKERRIPVQAYAIMGHDVDECFHPDPESIDKTKEEIKVTWKSYRGQDYEWTMVPLKDQDENIESNTMDRLLVYEPPERGNYYACGIDTADGLGKEDEDRTVLSVTNNRFKGESDNQVAELTSNKINSAQVVAFAACVGAWYGKNSPDGKGMKYVVEQIRGPGDTCQHQLKMMGFNNHHKPRRYDSKKIKDDAGKKEGWYSSAWSVPMLMDRFREAVNGGWYTPRSKWLIEELRTLERHEGAGKSKMEHRSGQHDDRVRAAAQSYFTAHDLDILTERAQKRSAPPKKKDKPKGPGSANQMSVGEDWT